jgi:serine/threonine protein kinase
MKKDTESGTQAGAGRDADWQRAKRIFGDALELPDEERSLFIERECAGHVAMLGQVREWLAARAELEDFLSAPTQGVRSERKHELSGPMLAESADYSTPLEDAAPTIGPYRLLKRIGQGGFGLVFLAQQDQPVRRRVALKVVKLGMDTHQVIARFELERQALALMDHPNIARVLDAGATTKGRPYFVMEFVEGVPITEYCDAHRLSTRERLALFIPVCQAVQHAHQKGIIHRDIKPGNVLIAVHDGSAVPKIIDFGIAKALHAGLTEMTVHTEVSQIIGTLEYMSPEQAGLSDQDIDTRSDIYSIGVLLYELLI